MTREEARLYIIRHCNPDYPKGKTEWERAVNMAIKALEQLEQRWIPVTERLPEVNGDYWVTVDPNYIPPGYRNVDVITWRDGKWLMADYFVLDGEDRKKPEYKVIDFALPIIAWMPLPDCYQGEGAE